MKEEKSVPQEKSEEKRLGGREGGSTGRQSFGSLWGLDFILCEMGIKRSILDKGGKDIIYICKRPLQLEKMGKK